MEAQNYTITGYDKDGKVVKIKTDKFHYHVLGSMYLLGLKERVTINASIKNVK